MYVALYQLVFLQRVIDRCQRRWLSLRHKERKIEPRFQWIFSTKASSYTDRSISWQTFSLLRLLKFSKIWEKHHFIGSLEPSSAEHAVNFWWWVSEFSLGLENNAWKWVNYAFYLARKTPRIFPKLLPRGLKLNNAKNVSSSIFVVTPFSGRENWKCGFAFVVLLTTRGIITCCRRRSFPKVEIGDFEWEPFNRTIELGSFSTIFQGLSHRTKTTTSCAAIHKKNQKW